MLGDRVSAVSARDPGRQYRALITVLAFASFPAQAHDFSGWPEMMAGVTVLQALPLLWIVQWRNARSIVWQIMAIVLAWFTAVAGTFGLNSPWPLLLLLAPWVFALFAGGRAREVAEVRLGIELQFRACVGVLGAAFVLGALFLMTEKRAVDAIVALAVGIAVIVLGLAGKRTWFERLGMLGERRDG